MTFRDKLAYFHEINCSLEKLIQVHDRFFSKLILDN